MSIDIEALAIKHGAKIINEDFDGLLYITGLELKALIGECLALKAEDYCKRFELAAWITEIEREGNWQFAGITQHRPSMEAMRDDGATITELFKDTQQIPSEVKQFEAIGEVSDCGYFMNQYKTKYYEPKSKVYLESQQIPSEVKAYIERLEKQLRKVEYNSCSVGLERDCGKTLASKPDCLKD